MSQPEVKFVEGFADFKVAGASYQTYYKVFGSISSSNPTPLVMLHGGPGIPSQYMELFSDLTSAHNIPLVVYDQIGCGKSTHLSDKGGDFFTADFFMDELENLLNHLKISDNFDLGGQSWGSILGALFAGKRKPRGLKHLILCNPLARMDDWVLSNQQLAKTLPKEVQDVIAKSEAAGTVDTKEYQDALNVFMGTYVCRINPLPEGVMASLIAMNEDRHVSHVM
jgi:L-proline amide hydrolase